MEDVMASAASTPSSAATNVRDSRSGETRNFAAGVDADDDDGDELLDVADDDDDAVDNCADATASSSRYRSAARGSARSKCTCEKTETTFMHSMMTNEVSE